MNGTPRQILAKITQARAMFGSPRKLMFWSMRPEWRSDQEMIENWLSKIHQNAMAESTVGTTNGISTIERTSDLNGMLLVEQQREVEPDRELHHGGDGRVEAAC